MQKEEKKPLVGRMQSKVQNHQCLYIHPVPAVPVRRLGSFLHGLDNFTTQFCVHLLPGRRVSVGKTPVAQGLAQGKDQGFAHVREVFLLHAKILVTLADLLEDFLYQLHIGSCVNTYKAIAKEKG
jgi:hypothetical protein